MQFATLQNRGSEKPSLHNSAGFAKVCNLVAPELQSFCGLLPRDGS
jgi:hypothetical protein